MVILIAINSSSIIVVKNCINIIFTVFGTLQAIFIIKLGLNKCISLSLSLYRMLVFYYNLKNNKVPYYLTSFLPNTSIARERYHIRNPRLQSPICSHEYISKTCKYRLPVLLNSINNNYVIAVKINNTVLI